MKKKIISRKGFTLVELVVTIAILGMVSMMGIGIVANSIKNYSTASVTSGEQDTALAIENFIVSAAKKATSFKQVNPSDVPEGNNIKAWYIASDNGVIKTVSNIVDNSGDAPVVTTREFKGVNNIEFTLRKQKKSKTDSVNNAYVCLDYVITMTEGYVIRGSVVVSGIPSNYDMTGIDSNSFSDTNDPIIISTNSSAAVALYGKVFGVQSSS